jgi:hypothetical protein
MTITVPAFMRFSLRKCIAFSACACLIVICSCEKHRVGEMPEVQREQVDVAAAPKKNPDAAAETSTSPMPPVKPTPVEFFPEATPR